VQQDQRNKSGKICVDAKWDYKGKQPSPFILHLAVQIEVLLCRQSGHPYLEASVIWRLSHWHGQHFQLAPEMHLFVDLVNRSLEKPISLIEKAAY